MFEKKNINNINVFFCYIIITRWALRLREGAGAGAVGGDVEVQSQINRLYTSVGIGEQQRQGEFVAASHWFICGTTIVLSARQSRTLVRTSVQSLRQFQGAYTAAHVDRTVTDVVRSQ